MNRNDVPSVAGLPRDGAHVYVVRAGTKVTTFSLTQFGDDFTDTSQDEAVLANMLKALKK